MGLSEPHRREGTDEANPQALNQQVLVSKFADAFFD